MIQDFDYNIGALKVLKLLAEAKIVSFSDFLQSVDNESEIQAIITDVLDSEDHQDVLVAIVDSLKSSNVINANFQACFKEYLKDLIEKPELIKFEFISVLERRLEPEAFRENIAEMLLDEIFQFDLNSDVEVTQVISNQKAWNEEFKNDKYELLTKVLKSVSLNHSNTLAKCLMRTLQTDQRVNWFYLLFALRLLDQKSKGCDELKSKCSDVEPYKRFILLFSIFRIQQKFVPEIH